MQLSHYNSRFQKKKWSIILVCDNVTKAPNIGSLLRICDAFGVEKVIFCGENVPIGRRMTKTSRATEKVVNYEKCDDISKVIEELKNQDYSIISLEVTENSIPISEFSISKPKIALVIGDENHGVNNEVIEQSEAVFHIEMFGQNSSMNVTHAAAIALYEITKQFSF